MIGGVDGALENRAWPLLSETDQNGTWEEFTVKNGEAVRKALFGSGEQDKKQLIQNVWIGGEKLDGTPMNNYRAINDVLRRLGFVEANGSHHGPTVTHYNHFHVDLRAPERLEFSRSLLADAIGTLGTNVLTLDDLPAPYNELLASAQADLQPRQGAFEMFVDLPPNGPAQLPIVMVAEAAQAQKPLGAQRTLGWCTPMENHPDDPIVGRITIDFPGAAANYLFYFEGNKRVSDAGAKVTLLQPPAHGRLIGGDTYIPDPDFHGQDKISALVELGGYQVKVVYFIKVVAEDQRVGDDEVSIKKYCGPKGNIWKISLQSTTPDMAALQPLLDHAGVGTTADVQTAELTGGAVGSTTGNTITLDDNASGYGWFIDATPGDNSEFLPTSNPNEWVAKQGSAAYGKMDLLTVLLHEYGHVLGTDHSADAHDFMATTLQPGVRRTLTVDQQLELMALAGYFPVPDSPSQPYGPTDPGVPLPFTRTSASRFGRMRPSFGQGKTEFDMVANPKLENTAFADGSAWATQGDVAFGDGTATLKETSTTQTRLNQVFVVGEHDRFLSFSLAGLGLGDQAAGPDDAFEVALIDASTGAALLGGTGLSRSDALLNLQANGNERKASNVSRLQNADGSRTYLVDLAGIAAGTVVNLSFDLIGFGKGFEATNSQITVRDLRIGVPQTADDSASGNEDSAIAIDALANDLNALQPGFVPVVVSGPAHGSVAVEANGSFTYLPHANWSGEDEFTYRLSDGVVDSNVATVRITVAPVNDAPTLADLSLAGQEDTVVSGNVLATATDVDGDALSAALVTGPTHGTLQLAAEGGFTYAPEADWYGEDSFTVRVNDGTLDSAIATVRLNVAAVVDGDELSVVLVN